MIFYSTTPVETRTTCYCGRHWVDENRFQQFERWRSTTAEIKRTIDNGRTFLSPMCIMDGHIGRVWVVTKDAQGKLFPYKQAMLVCDKEQRVYCINKSIRRFFIKCLWCPDGICAHPHDLWCAACDKIASAIIPSI